MNELYLSVRKNNEKFNVDVMRAMDESKTRFRQMPTKNLPFNQGRFRLDFEYLPKGEFAGTMNFSTGGSIDVYKTSIEELEELIAKRKKELNK